MVDTPSSSSSHTSSLSAKGERCITDKSSQLSSWSVSRMPRSSRVGPAVAVTSIAERWPASDENLVPLAAAPSAPADSEVRVLTPGSNVEAPSI
eukprot:scaffold60459_cov31-Tisochrysis_lutea.AAC.10